MWAPMNVCSLSPAAGVTMTTTLPITSATSATHYGFTPSNVTREFTCEIGLGSLTIGGGGVLTR